MRAKPMIFFDIDGTLVDHEEAEYRAAQAFQHEYRHYFSDSPEMFVQRWHTITEEHMERYLAGELSFQGQRRARVQALFAPYQALSDRDADDLFMRYLRHYENNWTLYSDVRESLHHLADYPLGIISNGDSVQQRQKLATLNIAFLFSTIVISGDIGISKPKRGIFIAACREAKISPAQSFYVGDRQQTDAEASTRAGLKGIWLDRKGKAQETQLPVIRSLAELRAIVESHD